MARAHGRVPADARKDERRELGRRPLAIPIITLAPSSRPPRPLVIAVLGSPRTGKSTFICNALNLPRHAAPASLEQLHPLTTADGTTHLVRLLELVLGDAPVHPPNALWDGACVIYDPTNRASLNHIAPILTALLRSTVPAVLVAAKWDLHPGHRRLAPDQLQQSDLLIDPSLAFCCSSDIPSRARNCLHTLVGFIEHNGAEVEWLEHSLSLRAGRPRRHTSSTRPLTALRDPRHARAASEYSLTPSSRSEEEPPGAAPPRRSQGLRVRSSTSRTPQLVLDTRPPALPTPKRRPLHQRSQDSPSGASLPQGDLSDGASMASDDSPDHATPASAVLSASSSALTLAELAERLLTAPTGPSQENFTIAFLSLYRIFAAPCELLELIIAHFEQIKDPKNFMKSLGSPNGDLRVLQQWITDFPGDFAHEYTRKSLEGFLTHVHADPDHAATAANLLHLLDQCTTDEDTGWCRSDDTLDKPGIASTLLSAAASATPSASPVSAHDFAVLTKPGTYPEGSASRTASIFSQSSSTLDGPRLGQSSSGSSQITVSSETALRDVSALAARPLLPFTKDEWRSFMDIADRSIAKELTRIDHAMFRLIQPRDLIRHATLPPDARALYPGTKTVSRMIDQFNHLFLFCCNLVLFRDKPKHRALALTKLMAVGRELRKLNNYNSLGALVAGIKSASISRLGATWDLVDEARKRDFERLGMLMNISRGHHAYRMAWDNSFGERIPFLAIHRRDLVVADQSKTYCSGGHSGMNSEEPATPLSPLAARKKINWRKFEIMGDVVASVRKAQLETSYADIITPNDLVRAIVLNSQIIKDEEALYEWSTQLEAGVMGPASPSVDQMKKKLVAFKKSYGLG